MVDEALLSGLKMGNEIAFRKLYELYAEKIYKTAYMMTNDKVAAQDVVREVFIKVFKKISDLKYKEAFSSWFYRITINSCLSYMSENSKVKVLFDENEFNNIPEERIYFNPEDNALERELYEEVMENIYKLPRLQRITIILYFYNEMTIKEIAGVMDCSEGTVKSRLFHGKKNLKEMLEHKKIGKGVSRYGFGKAD